MNALLVVAREALRIRVVDYPGCGLRVICILNDSVLTELKAQVVPCITAQLLRAWLHLSVKSKEIGFRTRASMFN